MCYKSFVIRKRMDQLHKECMCLPQKEIKIKLKKVEAEIEKDREWAEPEILLYGMSPLMYSTVHGSGRCKLYATKPCTCTNNI